MNRRYPRTYIPEWGDQSGSCGEIESLGATDFAEAVSSLRTICDACPNTGSCPAHHRYIVKELDYAAYAPQGPADLHMYRRPAFMEGPKEAKPVERAGMIFLRLDPLYDVYFILTSYTIIPERILLVVGEVQRTGPLACQEPKEFNDIWKALDYITTQPGAGASSAFLLVRKES